MDYSESTTKALNVLNCLMLEDKYNYNPQTVNKEQMIMDFYFLR